VQQRLCITEAGVFTVVQGTAVVNHQTHMHSPTDCGLCNAYAMIVMLEKTKAETFAVYVLQQPRVMWF
jgi:hypothetical protein